MTQGPFVTGLLFLFAGCGEPMFENAGSQHSLLEDREACAMEMEQSPAAHPDYVSQLFPLAIRSCQRLLPSSCE